jgi:hypothetical protein
MSYGVVAEDAVGSNFIDLRSPIVGWDLSRLIQKLKTRALAASS